MTSSPFHRGGTSMSYAACSCTPCSTRAGTPPTVAVVGDQRLALYHDRVALDRADLDAGVARVGVRAVPERHQAGAGELGLLDGLHEALARRVLARRLQRLHERIGGPEPVRDVAV